MSRIGKKPISVPKGVTIGVDGQTVRVEGPKGSLSHEVHPLVSVAWDEGEKTLSFAVPEGKEGDREPRASGARPARSSRTTSSVSARATPRCSRSRAWATPRRLRATA